MTAAPAAREKRGDMTSMQVGAPLLPASAPRRPGAGCAARGDVGRPRRRWPVISRPSVRCRSWLAAAAFLILPGHMDGIAGAAPPAVASGDLIVALQDVQQVVGEPALSVNSSAGRTRPTSDHSLDQQLAAPCRRLFNQDDESAGTWSNFATANYTAASNVGVMQSVAAYPDLRAAQQAYQSLKIAVQQCRSQYPTELAGPAYSFAILGRDTVGITYPDTVNGPGSVRLLHCQDRFVVDVSADHLSIDPRIAQAVLAQIEKRIA